MANVTPTPSTVLANDGAIVHYGKVSGEAIPAGRVVFRDTDGRYDMAKSSSLAASGTRAQLYYSLNTTAAANQPLALLEEGDLTMDGLTAGQLYILSDDDDGLIMPFTDIAATNIVVVVGVAVSATVLRVKFCNSGIVTNVA